MEKDEGNEVKIKKRHVYIMITALSFFVLGFLTNGFSGLNFSGMSEEEVGDKTLIFVTENFLKPQGRDAELVGVEATGKDLFTVKLNVKFGEQSQPTSLYVTRDGKLILGDTLIDLNEEAGQIPTQETSGTPGTPGEAPIVDVSVDDDPSLGPDDAPVTIIEFSDFQCPFCKRFRDETFDQIIQTYGDKIRFVYRDFPILSLHPPAQKAAEAAGCADDQGKFWEYHDKLYENLAIWPSNAILEFKKYASELGLDTATFDDCLDSGKRAPEVQKDLNDGQLARVLATPTFFINGKKIEGSQPFSVFKEIIDAELAK